MAGSAKVDRETVSGVASDLMLMMPLVRKKLLNLDDIKEKKGLPMTHVHLLALLRREGSTTVSEIARRFQIAKPNITPLIDRLERDGLVERVRAEADRRVVFIRLKDAGENRLNEICEAATENLLARSDILSKEDYRELKAACSTLIDIIYRATAER